MDILNQVAMSINRRPFNNYESLYRYCLRHGDSEEESRKTADWAHGSEVREIMQTALNVIMAMKGLSPSQSIVDRFDEDNTHMYTYHCITAAWDMALDEILDNYGGLK